MKWEIHIFQGVYVALNALLMWKMLFPHTLVFVFSSTWLGPVTGLSLSIGVVLFARENETVNNVNVGTNETWWN